MNFPKYSKISNVYNRDPETGKIKEGEYAYKVFRQLEDIIWVGTEKIDGTNIRLTWNGDRVGILGKREESQIPEFLFDALVKRYCTPEVEELFEQSFGGTPVVIYGEGYGKGIQACGVKYIPDGNDFIMFDVCFPESKQFLSWGDVVDIGAKLNIKCVPVVACGPLPALVRQVKIKPYSVVAKEELVSEGIVARPMTELRTNQGRVMCKIKTRDFE